MDSTLRVNFWLNVVLSAINLGIAFGHSWNWVSYFNLIVGVFCGLVAFGLRRYA